MQETERILFVDDDAAVRGAFKRSLRHHGFEIDLADGHQEALAKVEVNNYAVIAVDYRMPVMNGLELAQVLRKKQTDATYVLISAECDLELAVEAVNEYLVSFVIPKPWYAEELASILKRSLEGYWERAAQRALAKSLLDSRRNKPDISPEPIELST